MKNATTQWISIDEIPPTPQVYILIKTDNCKYPAIVGKFDGEAFTDADNKAEIFNVKFYANFNNY